MDILCLIGIPTDIASAIGDGNVYYLGTAKNYDVSSLAPTEYSNFTNGNFISLITTCYSQSTTLQTSLTGSTSKDFTVQNPTIHSSYIPSSRKA